MWKGRYELPIMNSFTHSAYRTHESNPLVAQKGSVRRPVPLCLYPTEWKIVSARRLARTDLWEGFAFGRDGAAR